MLTSSLDGCVAVWPLQDIAITNIVWYMAYKRKFGGGVVYCAIVLQRYCNSVSNAGGRGIKEGIASCTTASK